MKLRRLLLVAHVVAAWAALFGSQEALAVAPSATTNAASSITTTSAQFNGTVNPNGISTSAYYQYGTTTAYGSVSTANSYGSGTSAVPVTVTLNGASPNTTYHYRLVAVNSASQTTFGSDVSFTTLATATAPTATTLSASSVTTTSAQFNGTVNPNGTSTSAYFQYGTTTGYGSVSTANSYGSGNSAVSVAVTLNGATPNTTYHYRLVAVNSASQTTYGSDVSFTTLPSSIAPSATTLAATSVTTNSAQLNGTINPNGTSTSGYFEYGTTTSYGSTSTPGNFGSGNSTINVSTSLSGITANTTYHYRFVAVNAATPVQITYGGDVSFTTVAATVAPSATTLAATSITTTSAQFNGTVNPNGTSTSAYFEYGITTSYGSTSTPGSFGSGTSAVSVISTLNGATPNTTYHYRIVAVNSATPTQITYGSDMSFTTMAATAVPSATTLAATSITTNSAQLNGTVNPNGINTSAYFQYGPTTSYGGSSSPASCGSGTSGIGVQFINSSLNSNSIFHYRVVATSSAGTTYGSDMSFTTLASTNGPSVAVTSPQGGENWPSGSTQTITWSGTGSSANMAYYKIALSTDGGNTWPTAGTANDLTPTGLYSPSARSFSWLISSSLNTAQARIRVRALDASANILAESVEPANFTIGQASGKSDLAVVGSLSVNPSPVTSGNTLTVGLTITNIGAGNAPATTTHIQIKNAALTATIADQTFSTPPVLAGQTISQSFGITIPSGATPGNYNAYAAIDSTYTGNQGSGTSANDYGSSGVFAINAPAGTSSISGYISDSQSGQPLANVAVTFGSLSQTTNSSGYYSFTGLAAGSYTLAASLTGYTALTPTSVTLSGPLQRSFSLVSNLTANPTATLNGNVFDKTTGKPLSGVTVNLLIATSQVLQASQVTDSSGNFTFSSFPSSQYTVQVSVSPYQVFNSTQQFAGTCNLPIALITPTVSLGASTPSPKSADPVNTATGNYIYSRTDLKLPGPGLPLQFDRNYNSQSGALGTDSPLGFGWNHSYNVQLTTDVSGNVTVHWGDSKTDTYTLNGSGGFTPQAGFAIFDTLTSIPGGGYTLKKKDLTVYTFNPSNLLTSIVDKNGNTIQLTYTGANLTTIALVSSGRSVSLVYDANNHITRITDPLNRTIQFAYDANGNLISATDANANVTNYTYDASHEMLTVVDPRGNTVVTNVYDSLNRVVNSQKDAKGGQTSYVYDPADGKTTVTQPLGRITVDHFDTLDRLTEEDDALGNSTKYSYDNAGNRTLVTSKNGYTVNYTYDANGNVTGKTDSLGVTTTITYDANNNPLSRTDGLGNTTTFQYDANGNLTKAIDPLGDITTITYNGNGLPLTVTNPNNHVTTSAYDSAGNLQTLTDALSNLTTYTYDAAGRKLTVKDALNHVTTFAYDNNDNVLSVTDAANKAIVKTYDGNNNTLTVKDRNGNTTTYTYDAKDLLSTTTDPSGGVVTNTYDALDEKTAVNDANSGTTQFAYDAIGNMILVTDALGNVTHYSYDVNGNKITTTNPLGKVTHFTYDPLDRLTQTTDALNDVTTNVYDNLNRRISLTDAKSHTTAFSYDPLGHLTQVTDAASGMVKYTYDPAGNRISMTEPNGHHTTYAYDALNRLFQTTDPSGGTYTYTYDAVGNRITQKDPKNQTITYAYDVDNRLTTVTYPSGTPVGFTYDANGNRTGMSDALGTSTYVYNSLNRVTSATDAYGQVITYVYDHNGNRTTLSYAGKSVGYVYDADNRMKSATDWLSGATSYGYDVAGNLKSATNPNGTTVACSYDDVQRLIGLANTKADSTVISNYSLTLDPVGNQTQSAQNEPLSPIFSPTSVSYAYDADNRLTVASSTTCTYDANGNVTAKGTDTYTYDFENRLTQSSIGGVVTQYLYDGFGNRKAVVTGGATKRYIVDTSGTLAHVLAETNGTGSFTVGYVYGRGLISQITANGTAHYYHYDVRGSAIGLSDSTGTLTDEYAYDPFGKVLNSQGTTANPFKYVGRFGVMDEGNGLSYIRARYFSPDLGRFITKDPTTGKDGDSQSLHRYVYALNNPVRLVDTSGFCAQTANAAALASILQTNPNIANDFLLDLGINLTSNLRDALTQEAVTNYIFKNSLVDFLSKHGDLNAGEHAASVGSFVDSALTLTSIVQGGYSELQSQGYSIQTVENGWLNIGANLAFAIQNPDAGINALKAGVDSTTAIATNAVFSEASGGYIDPGITGQEVSNATNSLNFGNALYDNLHGTAIGGFLVF